MGKNIVISDSSLQLFFNNGIIPGKVAHLFNAGEQVFESIYNIEQLPERNIDDPLNFAFPIESIRVYYFVQERTVGLYDVFVEPLIACCWFQINFLKVFIKLRIVQEEIVH